MSITERIEMIFEESKRNGLLQPEAHFTEDLHMSAKEKFAALPIWEKIARSTAYSLENQDIFIEKYDKIIGRIYHLNDKKIEYFDPVFDCNTSTLKKIESEMEEFEELSKNQLIPGGAARGHIAWFWDRILKHGVSGMRSLYNKALEKAKDQTAVEFYSGVLILLDSITGWNNKHIEKLKELGMTEMVEICSRVPEYPARSFHEAVQAFYMQYLLVMRENPYGGNGPGRLDYYLWPYLEKDLKDGKCSLDSAKELINELFIRMDERIHIADGWVEAIVVGGSYPNGASAVNPLSFIIIESAIDLNLTHPSIYVRVPENPSDDFVSICAKYMMKGGNRAQILGDKAVIATLIERGMPYRDAVEYVCGGCMEIAPQGMSSDYLFTGANNIPKYVELAITGGRCLKTSTKLKHTKFKGLINCADFDEFYTDFENELKRIIHIFFKAIDFYSEESEKFRPSYLISSMIDDCLLRGRNMHGDGARYHDYGFAPIGIPNAADAIFAVKKAIFDEKFCTVEELVKALEANFEGFEKLRLRLKALPKYGQQNKEADELAHRVMTSVCNAFGSYTTRWKGKAKPVVLTFTWAPKFGGFLGATADGNFASKPVAQGITPQSASMTEGITAAICSNLSMPTELFTGGASTMWDFDPAWANEDIMKHVLMTFINGGGQIFQGNTTDVNELIKAQKNPEEYEHLIVRVGGFSARFVNLNNDLQNEIIDRHRHSM